MCFCLPEPGKITGFFFVFWLAPLQGSTAGKQQHLCEEVRIEIIFTNGDGNLKTHRFSCVLGTGSNAVVLQ